MELILSNVSLRLTNTWGKKGKFNIRFPECLFFCLPLYFLPGRILNGWTSLPLSIHCGKRRKIVCVGNVGIFLLLLLLRLMPFLLTFASRVCFVCLLFFFSVQWRRPDDTHALSNRQEHKMMHAKLQQMCTNTHTHTHPCTWIFVRTFFWHQILWCTNVFHDSQFS